MRKSDEPVGLASRSPSRRATVAEVHGTPSLPESLAELPIFDGIGAELTTALIEASSIHQYRAGSVIARGGEPVRGLHIIQRGIVDLAHQVGSHECGVLLLSSKDLLLPSATLFHEPSLVSARALTTTKVVVVEGATFEAAVRTSPLLAINFSRAVSGQWRMAVRTILDLNCRTAAQRLGAFLIRMADLQRSAEIAILPFGKRYLASRLGMTAETLSRALQIVARHGLFLRGHTIIIRNREAIEKFCGPDPYPESDEHSLDVFAI